MFGSGNNHFRMHRNYRVFWHCKIEKYNKCRIWWNCRSCVYLDGRNRRWLRQRKICWRWFVYLWCDSKTCRSCKRKLNIFFWKVMAQTMAFLLSKHPHIVNYPHSPHSFSVHLLNCYFPHFPVCNIAEKFIKCSCFLSCIYYRWVRKFPFYNVKTLCWRIYLDKDIICIREFTGR